MVKNDSNFIVKQYPHAPLLRRINFWCISQKGMILKDNLKNRDKPKHHDDLKIKTTQK